MSYAGHVNATRVAASTLAVSGLRDLLAVQYAYGATAGVVTIRDGAAWFETRTRAWAAAAPPRRRTGRRHGATGCGRG